MNLPKIVIFSTPLVSTWVFDETHRVLFDAGDGVTAMLDSRIHKIRLAAITHTHRDHCAGLMQLLNLRGGAGDFTAVYPAGSGSGRALAGFLTTFDSRSTGKVRWNPMDAGQDLAIEPPRHVLRTFATSHYPPTAPTRTMSVGYQIVRSVDKVKPELRDLPQRELDALRLEMGKGQITETVEDLLLSITGDTVPLEPATFAGSRVLLHECTFLDLHDTDGHGEGVHPHSTLADVLRCASEAHVGHLGLYHISRRYDEGLLMGRIRELCAEMAIPFPVSAAVPGRQYEDLLRQTVWPGLPAPVAEP